MRPFELILVLLCAAFSIRLSSLGRASGWIHGAQLLLAAVLMVQIVVEGWRWQMFPAYAATLLAVAVTPALLGATQASFFSTVAGVVLLAASVVSCLALPFVEPRVPRGPYGVGVTTLPVVVSRPPDAVEDELRAAPLVRVWYPSSHASVRAKDRISTHFRAVPTLPAVADAPVAHNATGFPVVVYFDGWPEDEINNINLIVELVSHGLVVASVQYPARLPGTSAAADALLRAHLARDMVAYSSDADFERSVRLTHARARIHAQDAIAVLDALATLNADSNSPFAHRLDIQRAGTLGFSFGGGIAAEASRLDSRIKAVVNLDGRHWGDALYKGVERPYMLIGEILPMPTAADLASTNGMIRYEAKLDQIDYPNLEANLRALGGVHVTIAGTAHMNFTDVALRSPLRRFSYGGTIDARRAQEIIQAYVVEFFSRYLLSTQAPPLSSPWPQYPETRVQAWPGSGAAQ